MTGDDLTRARPRGTGRRVWLAALAVALAFVVAVGCTRPAGEVDSAGSDEEPSDDVAGGGGAPSASAIDGAIAEGRFGTLDPVCGPAPDGEVYGPSGSQGVTGDSITVGTIADPNNFARPGVNQELFDASAVFAAWCNDLGGINGRKITINEHDAQLFQYNSVMTEACTTDFALVGGGGVFDASGQETRVGCTLPDFPGFMTSAEASGSDLVVITTPSGSSLGVGIDRYLQEEFPDSVEHVGILTGNLPALTGISDGYRRLAEPLGWTLVYDDQYNAIGESTWQPYAQKIADAGVKGLIYVGEPENLGLLVQSLAQIGHEMDWIQSTPNIYDPKLVASAGASLAEVPVYTQLSSVPFEVADESEALATYLALFERYLPDGKSRAMLGLSSFSAWLVFATAAKACGEELTRTCVVEQGLDVGLWDAGGLFPVVEPTDDGEPQGCFVAVKATPEGFDVIDWERNLGVYNCDPANIGGTGYGFEELEPGSVGVQLADVGLSMDDVE
jgi:hypothetical protein